MGKYAVYCEFRSDEDTTKFYGHILERTDLRTVDCIRVLTPGTAVRMECDEEYEARLIHILATDPRVSDYRPGTACFMRKHKVD